MLQASSGQIPLQSHGSKFPSSGNKQQLAIGTVLGVVSVQLANGNEGWSMGSAQTPGAVKEGGSALQPSFV